MKKFAQLLILALSLQLFTPATDKPAQANGSTISSSFHALAALLSGLGLGIGSCGIQDYFAPVLQLSHHHQGITSTVRDENRNIEGWKRIKVAAYLLLAGVSAEVISHFLAALSSHSK